MMPSIDDRSGQAQPRWYVRVDGVVYGPFDDQTLWTYVQEGRITGVSELSRHPATGYCSAASEPELAHWFRQAEPVPTVQQTPTSTHATTASVNQPAAAVLLVMAEIPSERAMTLLQALQSVGDTQRLGHSVWLVRAVMTADQLRDTLSRSLNPADRLFVMDATTADHATLNLGQMVEARMRHMLASTGRQI
ncbi:hypothetical protein ACFFUB_12130 [Algimonas porphyrae]|uniref:GYF domain-containing protein n=2 Tax=Algimonas porphyrae TaxID=1128113 RepID=A0ABQ5UVH2_9PROT|nr:hypothetical protein [Algimonas porphyrae]GLQ19156.1 hypothetical protein GCM10007854_01110 [Algimonas porphyrae]